MISKEELVDFSEDKLLFRHLACDSMFEEKGATQEEVKKYFPDYEPEPCAFFTFVYTIMDNSDDDGYDISEVSRRGKLILYEADNMYELDGLSSEILKEYFPDYEFKEDKQYLVGNGEEILDGEATIEALRELENAD